MELEILKEILAELKKLTAMQEEQGRINKLNMEKALKAQEMQKDKVKDLLKTINPQFADII